MPQRQKSQRHLYCTDWCRVLASRITQILALGYAKIYQHVGDWRWAMPPTPEFCLGGIAQCMPQCQKSQRHLYCTDWCRVLASRITQILALGYAKIYQHVGDWRWAMPPTPEFCLGGIAQCQSPTPGILRRSGI